VYSTCLYWAEIELFSIYTTDSLLEKMITDDKKPENFDPLNNLTDKPVYDWT